MNKCKNYLAILIITVMVFTHISPAFVLAQESPTPSVTPTPFAQNASSEQPTSTPTVTPGQQQKETKEGTVSNGNVGNTTIQTGNATNTSSAITSGNTNAVVSNSPSSAVITGSNGIESNNTATSSSDTKNVNQTNNASVSNNANQSSESGDNQSSGNVGDTTLKTGNANTSGTAITNVNSNIDGLMVSEFNVVDDQKGDIVLSPQAFASNCIAGCSTSGKVKNIDSGSNSENTTKQTNSAVVGNTMTLAANSGTNDASYNADGDNSIHTGDANVSANAMTFANNNISGNLTYGVVNIYGNLEGDIILPEFSDASANTGNRANFENNTINQTNKAVITNDLVLNAETGNNQSNYNTDGDTSIKTGSANVDANIVNIANNTIDGGMWWLVFINQAGNWIGKLIGSPDGSHIAASQEIEFTTGADSNSSVNNTTNQTNTANIHNTLNLSANTGNNTANYNTGGDNSIITGDANIIANVVNFVNNNIVGNGKLTVVFVNIFGSWVGDFVTPGQHKRDKTPNTKTDTEVRESIPVVNTVIQNTESQITPTPAEENATTTTTTSQKITYPNAVYASSSKAKKHGVPLAYTQTQVAGASTDVSGKGVLKQLIGGESKKVVNINLAYLILLLPVFVLGLIAKKLIFHKFLFKNN